MKELLIWWLKFESGKKGGILASMSTSQSVVQIVNTITIQKDLNHSIDILYDKIINIPIISDFLLICEIPYNYTFIGYNY